MNVNNKAIVQDNLITAEQYLINKTLTWAKCSNWLGKAFSSLCLQVLYLRAICIFYGG
jgi:hypothetical protein